jgi:hypothetical protein
LFKERRHASKKKRKNTEEDWIKSCFFALLNYSLEHTKQGSEQARVSQLINENRTTTTTTATTTQ